MSRNDRVSFITLCQLSISYTKGFGKYKFIIKIYDNNIFIKLLLFIYKIKKNIKSVIAKASLSQNIFHSQNYYIYKVVYM